MDVSILIVSYNTRERTLRAIESALAEAGDLAVEVLVADNASKDGSAEAIRARFPDVRLLAESENHGFAGGNLLLAQEARGTWLLLLNPDAVVLPGALEAVVELARRRPEAGIFGGWTLEEDGSKNPGFAWGRATLWSTLSRTLGLASVFRRSALLNPEGVGTWTAEVEREVDIVSGCFLLVDRALWERLGGFDSDFFMYGEDADLCLRARALGFRPHITPAARVVHVGGASEPERGGKLVRLFAAKVLLANKHDGPLRALLMRWLLLVQAWTRSLGFGVLGLLGNQRAARSADAWGTLIAHRRDWMRGHFGDLARGKR